MDFAYRQFYSFVSECGSEYPIIRTLCLLARIYLENYPISLGDRISHDSRKKDHHKIVKKFLYCKNRKNMVDNTKNLCTVLTCLGVLAILTVMIIILVKMEKCCKKSNESLVLGQPSAIDECNSDCQKDPNSHGPGAWRCAAASRPPVACCRTFCLNKGI